MLDWGVGTVPRPCAGLLSVGVRRGAPDGELEFWGFEILVLLCFGSRGAGMGGLFSWGPCGFLDLGGGALVIADRKTCISKFT